MSTHKVNMGNFQSHWGGALLTDLHQTSAKTFLEQCLIMPEGFNSIGAELFEFLKRTQTNTTFLYI